MFDLFTPVLEKKIEQGEITRHVVLVFSWSAPQSVTRGCYALLNTSPLIRRLPTECHFISSSKGIEKAQQQLLDQGFLLQMTQSLDAAPLQFGFDQLHPLLNTQGQALTHLRTPEAQEQAGTLIVELIRELASCEKTQLTLIAPECTLEAYMRAGLSLFGHDHCQYRHLWVKPELKPRADFFYPTGIHSKQETVRTYKAQQPVQLNAIKQVPSLAQAALKPSLIRFLLQQLGHGRPLEKLLGYDRKPFSQDCCKLLTPSLHCQSHRCDHSARQELGFRLGRSEGLAEETEFGQSRLYF